MLRSTASDISTARSFSALRGAMVCIAASAMVLSGSASGQQSGGVPSVLGISQSTQSGGGGTSSGSSFYVEGSVGQVLSGRMQGGTFQILSGFMSSEGSICEQTDFNCDGEVDGADLGVLLLHWGVCPGGRVGCTGDFNCDGFVNGADLGLLLQSWG